MYFNLTHQREHAVKVELLLHRTVVPLFTDVAGTVRLYCTVPEDELTTQVTSIHKKTSSQADLK